MSAPRKNAFSPRQIFLIGLFWLIISIPAAVVLQSFAGIVFLLGLVFMFAGYKGKKNLRKQMQMGVQGAYPPQTANQAHQFRLRP